MDLGGLLNDVTGIAEGYVGSGINVAVKTNYGPQLTVYSGSSDGSATGAGGSAGAIGHALSKLAGLEVGVVVRDAGGRTLATYGPNNGEPATDWVRVGALLAIVGLLGLGLVYALKG